MIHHFTLKEVKLNETDLSAQEKTENERARLQKKNEHQKRQKRFEEKKSKGKKEIVCVIQINSNAEKKRIKKKN